MLHRLSKPIPFVRPKIQDCEFLAVSKSYCLEPNALLAIFQAPNVQKIGFVNSLFSQKDVQMLSNLNRRFFANNQYGLVCSFLKLWFWWNRYGCFYKNTWFFENTKENQGFHLFFTTWPPQYFQAKYTEGSFCRLDFTITRICLISNLLLSTTYNPMYLVD